MLIRGERWFAAGEGGDQHDERGLGQVEVGEQGADDAEVESGIDEDVGRAGLGGDAAVGRLTGGVFEGADSGCADSDDAAAGVAGELDFLPRYGRNRIPLAVDFVLLDDLDADGLEGAESDVQGDFGGVDAAGADAVENLGREMKA